MKKNKIILALIALVTFGFVLVGCGDGAYTPTYKVENAIKLLDTNADDDDVNAAKDSIDNALMAHYGKEMYTSGGNPTYKEKVEALFEEWKTANSDDQRRTAITKINGLLSAITVENWKVTDTFLDIPTN